MITNLAIKHFKNIHEHEFWFSSLNRLSAHTCLQQLFLHLKSIAVYNDLSNLDASNAPIKIYILIKKKPQSVKIFTQKILTDHSRDLRVWRKISHLRWKKSAQRNDN